VIGAAVAEDLGVDTDGLNRHAASIDKAVIAINQAAAAGEHVRLGSDAYGFLCQMLPAALDSIQKTAVSAGRDMAFSLSTVADLMRETAYTYRGDEQAVEDTFRNLGSRTSSGGGP
jgi:hypothetical protein